MNGWEYREVHVCCEGKQNKSRFMQRLSDYEMYGCSLKKTENKQTPWPESVSELYRLCDCRLSAKLV
jgi:hypothetical protein